MRRKFYLKNTSQPALILRTYFILFMVMVLSGMVFYLVGNKNLTTEYFQAHSVLKTTMELFLPALILVNVIGLIGASFLVISFTHSIAGPIYRLEKLSEQICSGDLSLKVAFRKKDSLQELSEVINKIITGLNSRLKRLEEPLLQLQKLNSKIERMDKLSEDELLELRSALLSAVAKFGESMKEFKL